MTSATLTVNHFQCLQRPSIAINGGVYSIAVGFNTKDIFLNTKG
jgi:hypothetical protein